MRIIQTLHAFNENGIGGCEVYTARLAQALGERHDVTLLFPVEELGARQVTAQGTTVCGLNAIRLTRPKILHPAKLYRSEALDEWFDDFLRRERPDVVHVQHLLRLSTGWLEIAHARRVPTVVTLHDFWYVCPAITMTRDDDELCEGPEAGAACVRCPRRLREWSQLDTDEGRRPGGLRGRLRGILGHRESGEEAVEAAISEALRENRKLLKLPHAVLSPSRFMAEAYHRHGIEREIRVLAHGVPFTKHARKRPSDVLRLGYLGNVAPHKGVHILVEAVKRMASERLSLDIHGHVTESYRHELERIVGGDRRIRLRVSFSSDDLPEIHAGIDILVVPSLWHENSPLVVQEALALGTPAIVSDRGGMPELIHGGVNGLVVPAGDVDALAEILCSLALDPQKLQTLRARREDVFTSEDNARAVQALYEKACRAKPG